MNRNRVTKSVDEILAQNPELILSNNDEATRADVDLQHWLSKIVEVQQPFPVDVLPPAMRDMVTAVSNAERLPTAQAACCTLGIVSAALGKGVKIYSHPGKTCPGNLYILNASPSGSNKTETMRPFLAPIQQVDAKRAEDWRINTPPRLMAEIKCHEGDIKRLERQLSNKKLIPDRGQILAQLVDLVRKVESLKESLNPPACSARTPPARRLRCV